MALLTWLTMFPMVVGLVYLLAPLRLPFVVSIGLSTGINVALLTWIVMPRLTRALHRWLYAQ